MKNFNRLIFSVIFVLILNTTNLFAQCSFSTLWLNQSSNALTSPFSTGGFSSNPVLISGTLTINSAFVINNSDIYMKVGSKIEIINNGSLTLDNVHIHACDNVMWDSIIVNSTASIALNVKGGTVIEDAKTAISQMNGGVILDGAQLNKNFTGIFIHFGVTPTNIFSIKDSKITCYASFNIPNSRGNALYSPFSGRATNVGIDINALNSVNIGDPNSSINTFDNIEYPISSYRSNIYLKNNLFDYTKFSAINCQSYGYQGPYYVSIGGISNSERNFFYHSNNATGINILYNYEVKIFNNIFDQINLAIYVFNIFTNPTLPYPCNVLIDGNSIDNFNVGIRCDGLYNCPSVKVSKNILNSNSPSLGNIGIDLVPRTKPLSNFIITDNLIKNCYKAINMLNIIKSEISNNNVNYDGSAAQTNRIGIRLNYGSMNMISDNTISVSNTNLNTSITGLELTATTRTSVKSNTITKNSIINNIIGISAKTTCTGTRFICNNLNNLNYGFTLGSALTAAFISDQGTLNDPFDNKWINISIDRIKGYSTNTHYWFYRTGSLYYPQSSGVNIIITPAVNYPVNTCTSMISTLVANEDINRILNEDPDSLYPNHVNELDYLNKYFVMDYLINDSSLLSTSLKYENFYIDSFNSNLGLISRIRYYLTNGPMDSVVSLYNSLSPSNLIEENFKKMYDILLNRSLIDSIGTINSNYLSSEDSLIVQQIACQNSLSGGELPVYWARSILNLEINDDEGCDKKVLNNDKKIDDSSVVVYPNPSSKVIHFRFIRCDFSDLDIYNIYGDLIKSYRSINTDSNISIDKEGIYLFNFKNNNDHVFKKVIVQ